MGGPGTGGGGPLVLRVEDAEIVLLRGDVGAVDELMDAYSDAVRAAAERADSPEARVAAERTLHGVGELRAELAASGGTLSPFDLSPQQSRLLRSALAEATGYQRRELTPALKELREALSKG